MKTEILKPGGIDNFPFLLALLLIAAVTFVTGCTDKCDVKTTYTYYEPVYTTMEEIRSSVATLPAQELRQTGKIFYQGGFLFINEPNEGVHVINNSNPAQPQNIAFINIPGSFDLAVKGNVLFADSYVDLVAIDISDLNQVKEIGRIKDLFISYNSYGFYVDAERGVVTDWKAVEQVNLYESDCEVYTYDWGTYYQDGIAVTNAQTFNANFAIAPGNAGVAGSMARFTLREDYLYAIDQSELYPVNISNAASMSADAKVSVDWGIETIFNKGANLFIGAQSGMFIMDVSNPSAPVQIANYQHVRSCDPVIVDDKYAYVTLRNGSECQGFVNQLEVIDISDLTNPQLLHVYDLFNPHGLGKDGNALFICDGADGLKIYNAENVGDIDQNLLAHYKDIQAFDIIPFNNVAMMIGEDGLYQYDYSDLNNITLLSHIKISNDEN